MQDLLMLEEFIKETLLDEESKKRKSKKKSTKTKYPSQYKAKGKRKKKLDRATSLAKSSKASDRQKAYKIRDNMEKSERKKKGFKNVPRHDSKK